MGAVEQMYGGEQFYHTTAIVTMAPELDPDGQVCLYTREAAQQDLTLEMEPFCKSLNSINNASFSGVKSRITSMGSSSDQYCR